MIRLGKFTARRRLLLPLMVCCAPAMLAAPTAAAESVLAPQTKLHVNVVQWIPLKGAYEEWGALGGDYTVSEQGTISLPVVGEISVSTFDTPELAAEISKRIQSRTGLVDRPDTTVQIVESPPIYVVGEVTNPGVYQYRPGMTVLQALALSGGQVRDQAPLSQQTTRTLGELKSHENAVTRSSVRIARLQAELAGDKDIKFPTMPSAGPQKLLHQEVASRETIIFHARAEELERQANSYGELRDLLKAEIEVLEQKVTAADAGIASMEAELQNVTTLVARGIAVASRQSDLERSLSSYRGDRLDQVTAIMRARQAISEATRNLESLKDSRRTEIASDLQTEQATLDQEVLNRDLSQKLLLDSLATSGSPAGADTLTYLIVRNQQDPQEISAVESTQLRPGDVVKIAITRQEAVATPIRAQDDTTVFGQ